MDQEEKVTLNDVYQDCLEHVNNEIPGTKEFKESLADLKELHAMVQSDKRAESDIDLRVRELQEKYNERKSERKNRVISALCTVGAAAIGGLIGFVGIVYKANSEASTADKNREYDGECFIKGLEFEEDGVLTSKTFSEQRQKQNRR